jgi:hypothetical protein
MVGSDERSTCISDPFLQLSEAALQLCGQHPQATLQELIQMAQNTVAAQQQQQHQMHMQLANHPIFSRLTPDQQRQLTTLPPNQIRSVRSTSLRFYC